MKKLTLTLSLLLLANVSFADTQQTFYEEIPLQVNSIDPTREYDPFTQNIVQAPSITLDSLTLRFATPCDDCVLSIINEEGNIAYTESISEGTTSITLPSYLSGLYRIQIKYGAYYFEGNIFISTPN